MGNNNPSGEGSSYRLEAGINSYYNRKEVSDIKGIIDILLHKEPHTEAFPTMIEQYFEYGVSYQRRQSITNWDDLPAMLTIPDMMNIFGVSRTTAYQMTSIKDFPAVRIGKLIYIDKQALRDWIYKKSNQ